MTAPIVFSVSPNSGLTGGRRLVVINGGHFQLPPTPPPAGPTTPFNPSVEVLFGTEPALDVRVLSPTLLHVISPIHDPGTVDVTVRNIDQSGVLIGAETFTVPNAFTFSRPQLALHPNDEGIVARIVRAIILEMRRQIVPVVELTTHVDYDNTPSGANIAALSEIPGIVIVGPTLRENRFFSLNQPRAISQGGGQYQELRPPYTVDLLFTLIGVDDATQRLVNFLQETTLFFHRNKYLRLLRDPLVPGVYVNYEMEIQPDGVPSWQGTATENNSNIRSFSGSFLIRGVDLDEASMARLQTSQLVDPIPSGVAGVDGYVPSPIILQGQPGVTTAAPIPSGPVPALGTPGVIEQIGDDE